jgi:hypothetical protein
MIEKRAWAADFAQLVAAENAPTADPTDLRLVLSAKIRFGATTNRLDHWNSYVNLVKNLAQCQVFSFEARP